MSPRRVSIQHIFPSAHGVRRALAVDLRLNASNLGGAAIWAAFALIGLLLRTSLLTELVPLYAAFAWYRYGRADTIERRAVQAALGVSRADRVRGRVALVGIESVFMVAVSAIGTWVTDLRGAPDDAMDASTLPTTASGIALDVVATIVGGAFVLLLVAIAVGRECTTRRPGGGMLGITLAVFVGASLLSGVVLSMLTWSTFEDSGALAAGASVLAALVVVAVTAGVLAGRIRSWIGDLDSGAGAARR